MGSGHLRHSSASRRFQTGFALTSRSRSNLLQGEKEISDIFGMMAVRLVYLCVRYVTSRRVLRKTKKKYQRHPQEITALCARASTPFWVVVAAAAKTHFEMNSRHMYMSAVSMLQTCASNASSTTRVSTNAAHAIWVRASVERRSSQKRTVQFQRSMLRQYSAHTESFPDCAAVGEYSPRCWYSPGKSSWN